MIIHFVPDNDRKPHDISSTHCTCDYTTVIVNSHMMIVHSAFDLREMVEQANFELGNENPGPGWTLMSCELVPK
jgi:hypothetical protein